MRHAKTKQCKIKIYQNIKGKKCKSKICQKSKSKHLADLRPEYSKQILELLQALPNKQDQETMYKLESQQNQFDKELMQLQNRLKCNEELHQALQYQQQNLIQEMTKYQQELYKILEYQKVEVQQYQKQLAFDCKQALHNIALECKHAQKTDQLYTCEECGFQLKSRIGLDFHMQKKHAYNK